MRLKDGLYENNKLAHGDWSRSEESTIKPYASPAS
jgi:hypothetical protein